MYQENLHYNPSTLIDPKLRRWEGQSLQKNNPYFFCTVQLIDNPAALWFNGILCTYCYVIGTGKKSTQKSLKTSLFVKKFLIQNVKFQKDFPFIIFRFLDKGASYFYCENTATNNNKNIAIVPVFKIIFT